MYKTHNNNLRSVLAEDGVSSLELKKYENRSTVNLHELREEMGMGSWAVRIAYNELFGGVIIQQQQGEGNRRHYHHDADENWVILDGEWEWWIDGVGTQRVEKDDIVVVPKGVLHQITCVKGPGVRYAITRPDVDHVYLEENNES